MEPRPPKLKHEQSTSPTLKNIIDNLATPDNRVQTIESLVAGNLSLVGVQLLSRDDVVPIQEIFEQSADDNVTQIATSTFVDREPCPGSASDVG